MQRAVYSPEEEGHFALASDCYCHFTSPIRRYPDLTIHRLIEHQSRQGRPSSIWGNCSRLGDHCSEREQRATRQNANSTKSSCCFICKTRSASRWKASSPASRVSALFVTGTEIPAEGFVHITSLSDDYYKFDRAGHVIKGFRSGNTYRLGDPVRVAVASVDVDRRELDFRLLEKLGGSTGGRVTKPTRDKKARPQKPRKRKPKRKRR